MALDALSLGLSVICHATAVMPRVWGRDASLQHTLFSSPGRRTDFDQRTKAVLASEGDHYQKHRSLAALMKEIGFFEEWADFGLEPASDRLEATLVSDTWLRLAGFAEGVQDVLGEPGFGGVKKKDCGLALALAIRRELQLKEAFPTVLDPRDEVLSLVKALEQIALNGDQKDLAAKFRQRLVWVAEDKLGRPKDTELLQRLKKLYDVRSRHAHSLGDQDAAGAWRGFARDFLDALLEGIVVQKEIRDSFVNKRRFKEMMASANFSEPV